MNWGNLHMNFCTHFFKNVVKMFPLKALYRQLKIFIHIFIPSFLQKDQNGVYSSSPLFSAQPFEIGEVEKGRFVVKEGFEPVSSSSRTLHHHGSPG